MGVIYVVLSLHDDVFKYRLSSLINVCDDTNTPISKKGDKLGWRHLGILHGCVDARLKKSDSAIKRTTMFAKQATNRKGVAPRSTPRSRPCIWVAHRLSTSRYGVAHPFCTVAQARHPLVCCWIPSDEQSCKPVISFYVQPSAQLQCSTIPPFLR